jgi:hypothetical protein
LGEDFLVAGVGQLGTGGGELIGGTHEFGEEGAEGSEPLEAEVEGLF